MHPNLGSGEDIQEFLDAQIKNLQTKATALTEAIADSVATVTSRDGSVTVTVEANGALRDLKLGHRAGDQSPARLTAAIMEAVRTAQRQTANSVADSVAEITGEGDSTDLIRTFLPPQDEPDTDDDENRFVKDPEPDPESTPPPAVASQPPARGRRPAADDDDDDYEERRPW